MNTHAKYSIDDLPGDEWETRRTKQIIRAIIRAKNELGVTTENLATSCSALLGEPGAIKTATLNGLFAGKRKAISTTELQMFSQVLMVPMLDLIYPPGESVEVWPGDFKASADALSDAIAPAVFRAPVIRLGGRTEAVVALQRRFNMLEESFARAIWATRTSSSMSKQHLSEAKWHLESFFSEYSTFEALDDGGITLPAHLGWLLDPDGGVRFLESHAITQEFLNEIEPFFKGVTIGDYRLGGEPDA